MTNDPQQKQLTLSVRFVVGTADSPPPGRRVGWFIVSPSDTLRGRASRGNSFVASATIHNTGPQPVRFVKAIPNGSAFEVKLETLEEGKRYVVAARSSPSLPPGEHRQTVKLLTDNSDYPDLEIDLQVTVFEDPGAKPGKN